MIRPNTALVLSGGGARGAYQAGVLKGLLHLGVLGSGPLPFDILVGTSAGSINSATLAAFADRVERGVADLVSYWSRLRATQVFRTDALSIAHTAWEWIRDLSFGGLLGNVRPKSLLNTEPLRRTLRNIPLERIAGHIASGRLRALGIGATNYYTSNGILFLEGNQDIKLWERARYHVERTVINIDHLLASSAIPIFFPAVQIDGRHFGDGCIRNTAPLSPAIQLGATRVVAVGVRQSLSIPEFNENEEGQPLPVATAGGSLHEANAEGLAHGGRNGPPVYESARPRRERPVRHLVRGRTRKAPTLATIAGVLLDAVMIDAMEVDVDHCTRINRSVARLNGSFRHIDVLWLRPSISFTALATRLENRIPWLTHYLLRGLGDDEDAAELASYLLFDAAFCNRLIDQGVADVLAQKKEIIEFFERP